MNLFRLKNSNSTNPKFNELALFLVALVLVCFGLSPAARAVLPPPAPDGGYPNQNTAEGDFSLTSLSIGTWNSAFGYAALNSNTFGSQNTGIGAGALYLNSGGNFNTAIGFDALIMNTSGGSNTAIGWSALLSNTTGQFQTAVGFGALQNCIAPPDFAGNTAIGSRALRHDTTGNFNTAIGDAALVTNTIGVANTAIGLDALAFNDTGNENTATGANALFNNIGGVKNTASGTFALFTNTTGNENTAVGRNALVQSNASSNTAIGNFALQSNTSGSNNTALGFAAGSSVITAHDVISLGAVGADVSNSCFIGQVSGVNEGGTMSAVFINTDGRLGTQGPPSSRRFKKEIKPMKQTSEAILGLKPVTFHYKSDTKDTPQFGLIAEEVAQVNPDLVVRDENGDVYSVRYEAVNAMLLNEFLKEHRTVQELKSTVAKQEATAAQHQKQIEALTAGLQKVSAQVEASKPAPRVVNNP
jgi:hypothetical protein